MWTLNFTEETWLPSKVTVKTLILEISGDKRRWSTVSAGAGRFRMERQ